MNNDPRLAVRGCAAAARWVGRALLLLVVATAALPAHAATVYVYSFIGRQLTIVNATGDATSPVDRKQRTFIQMPNDDFDSGVVADAQKIVGALSPPFAAMRLTSPQDSNPDPAYDKLANLSVNDWFARIAPTATFAVGDRLVVIAPLQADIRYAVFSGNAGLGQAAGLGIYLEPAIDQTGPVDTHANGMVGIFANLRVLVIDPLSRRFVAEKAISRGIARSGKGAPGNVLWNAVPDREKFVLLRDVVRAGLQQTLPELLGN